MTPHPPGTPFIIVLQDPLWTINRMIDLIFFTDMIISFHVMYRTPKSEGAALVKDIKKVRYRCHIIITITCRKNKFNEQNSVDPLFKLSNSQKK